MAKKSSPHKLDADKILLFFETLIGKYGKDELSARVIQYANLVEKISALHKSLLIAASEEIYAKLVSQVMEATRAYYDYSGSLPEDLRHLFQVIYEAIPDEEPDDERIDLLSALVNQQMPATRLPALQAIRPKKYIMQLDAVTGQLPSLTDQTQLRVGTRGHQPIKTTVTLDIPAHMRIEGGAALTPYDKSVLNGVTSLLECGNTAFSIPMLYHAMTGKQNPTLDDILLEELTGKLERMRRLMINIDLTEELRAKLLTDECGVPIDFQDVSIEGYLLPLNKISGVVNGKHTTLYQLLDAPPLYTYSKLKRQLASVPLTLLGAPLNNNATTIPLKTYLIQRIELMKNPHNQIRSHNILYDAIYRELGEPDANKTRRARIRTYTSTILSYFIEQGYIESYHEYRTGRSIAGIRVQPVEE